MYVAHVEIASSVVVLWTSQRGLLAKNRPPNSQTLHRTALRVYRACERFRVCSQMQSNAMRVVLSPDEGTTKRERCERVFYIRICTLLYTNKEKVTHTSSMHMYDIIFVYEVEEYADDQQQSKPLPAKKRRKMVHHIPLFCAPGEKMRNMINFFFYMIFAVPASYRNEIATVSHFPSLHVVARRQPTKLMPGTAVCAVSSNGLSYRKCR